jgi:hypothetical protein
MFPPGSVAIGSHVPAGMRFANRHCPDENLLRQNWFHSTMNRFRRNRVPIISTCQIE